MRFRPRWSQQVTDKLADVLIDIPAFLDRRHDRGEIVVAQHEWRASLVTSVPVMPMAMPISAALIAGASFTPSPVIATTWPRRCSALTMRSLCSGETRAYT